MIWAMVKDSPAWRIAGCMSVVYVAGWLILTQGDPHGVSVGAPMLVYMTHMAATAYNPDSAFRCTFFDAALPVTGRQLWISKMIVLLGGLWLPVLAASAVGFLVMRNPAMPFLEAAAGISLIYLFAQGFRIREFHEPRWACVTALIVGGGVITAVDELAADSAMLVLASYLLAGATVFLVNLARVPKSFECARPDAVPEKPVRLRQEASGTANPRLVWWPLIRSVYPWQIGIIFMAAAFLSSGGNSVMAVFGFVPPVVGLSRKAWLHLAHLPVGYRKLFWSTWMPMAAMVLAGYLAGVWPIHRSIPAAVRDPRIVATALALLLAMFLLWAFLWQSWQWRRIQNIPTLWKAALMAAYPIGLAAAWISIPSNEVWRQFGIDPVSYFALRLADMLPENPLLLGLVLAIPLAGLYWLAERSFCEMEYPAASPQADGLRYLQRAS